MEEMYTRTWLEIEEFEEEDVITASLLPEDQLPLPQEEDPTEPAPQEPSY